MKDLWISLHSEFYKTRKTLAFLSAILLPLLLCSLIAFGFLWHAQKLAAYPPQLQWMRFSGAFFGVMGSFLLPVLIIFQTYSINAIEHQSQMWKSLFALPIPKWTLYSAKFLYALFLNVLCLSAFAFFILALGFLLSKLDARLRFDEYNFILPVLKFHLKFLMASIGLLSIQFFLSLFWDDFLKPMGIGILLTVVGLVTVNLNWKYAYLFPYAHPQKTVNDIYATVFRTQEPNLNFPLLSTEFYVSVAFALAAFLMGFILVSRKSSN